MAVVIIPTRDDIGAYFFKVELDGVLYELAFQHNDREKHWYMDLRTGDGNPIRSGIKLVANFPLLRMLSTLNRPAGELLVLNTQNDNDPDLKDLRSLSQLVYISREEI
jgi:hypothetical protein